MRKHRAVLFIVMFQLFVTTVVAQKVKQRIYIQDSSGNTRVLTFGYHPMATDCIDEQFDEMEPPIGAPPFPLEAMFIDHRSPSGVCLGAGIAFNNIHWLGLAGSRYDTFKIGVFAASYPIYLSWDSASLQNDLLSAELKIQGSIAPHTTNMFTASFDSIIDPDVDRFIIRTRTFPVEDDTYYLPPWVVKSSSANPTSLSVELNSTVILAGNNNYCWFEWGTTTAYGNETPHVINNSKSFSQDITGLFPNTWYHYRAVIQGGDRNDIDFTSDKTFRTLSPNEVKEESNTPQTFSLSQNYPNPFNPTTDLGFRIANLGLVTLKIYNILGQQVALLVNEKKPAGEYTVQWNANGLPGGVYYYALISGGKASTKKMILMR